RLVAAACQQALLDLLQHIPGLPPDVHVTTLGHHAREKNDAIEDRGLAVARGHAEAGDVLVGGHGAFFFAPILLSLPAIRRLMFSAWRQTSSSPMAARLSTSGRGALQATP